MIVDESAYYGGVRPQKRYRCWRARRDYTHLKRLNPQCEFPILVISPGERRRGLKPLRRRGIRFSVNLPEQDLSRCVKLTFSVAPPYMADQ
jgi:hypothetical protein